MTNRINCLKTWKSNENEKKDRLDIYEKCVVLMRQEIPYVPQINSFDDVLRMREKKELIRFKEVLNYWTSLMTQNEVELANKMRSDIIKANKDLKKYCEYEKKATTFFFFFSLFTSFIPGIPGITWWGIENVSKKIISSNIEKNSWVAIGKE